MSGASNRGRQQASYQGGSVGELQMGHLLCRPTGD